MRRGWRISAVAAALATAIGVGANAQTPPEGLAWLAVREVNAAWDNDREPLNRPPVTWAAPEGMLRLVDVSRDGDADWLMDYLHAGSNHFCGTGGCRQRLYVSRDGELLAAFDGRASALEITERDGETVIEAQVHHLNCAPEAQDCRFAWTWDPALGRLVERVPSTGATHLFDGGFQPLEPQKDRETDHLPAALSQVWFGGRLTCPSQADDGFEVFRPRVLSVPDLTGDGVREWMVIPPAPCDMDAPLPGFAIWAGDGRGDVREVHVSAYDAVGVIDIAAAPATLIEQRGCGHESECVRTPLRWNAATGRFDRGR